MLYKQLFASFGDYLVRFWLSARIPGFLCGLKSAPIKSSTMVSMPTPIVKKVRISELFGWFTLSLLCSVQKFKLFKFTFYKSFKNHSTRLLLVIYHFEIVHFAKSFVKMSENRKTFASNTRRTRSSIPSLPPLVRSSTPAHQDAKNTPARAERMSPRPSSGVAFPTSSKYGVGSQSPLPVSPVSPKSGKTEPRKRPVSVNYMHPGSSTEVRRRRNLPASRKPVNQTGNIVQQASLSINNNNEDNPTQRHHQQVSASDCLQQV